MQYASLVLFCDECGLANDPTAVCCTGCQQRLIFTDTMLSSTSPMTPAVVAPPAVLEVTPGPLIMPASQGASGLLAQYPMCDFRPGSILAGYYEIGKEIGRGGFSTVYHAVDHRPGYYYREVAIKRIQLNQLSPRQIIDATETFNREVAMLARFRAFSGIPAYYEHLTDAENWYLITQYIEGETLEEYLQKAPGGFLAEKETITLGIALAELIQRLHSATPPVIFRDLKPSNIMVTADRSFFLIDFGIARTYTPDKTRDTTPLGSPGYAPPEQYGKAQTDQRSDIYSLGATLQNLLTGCDLLELRSGIPARNPCPPSRGLRKLLDEMLAPDPSQRPTDMAQVKQRLEYALYRPRMIFLSGLIWSSVCETGVLFSNVSPFGPGSEGIITWACILLAGLFMLLFHKKTRFLTKTPGSMRGFWVTGAIVGALPFFLWFLVSRWIF